MKSIECINFVSNDAPNILLIASVLNELQFGYYLKHFKNSHNIYTIQHELNNNFEFYHDLPSKHDFIKQELDKNNLKEFTISTVSFGSFLAFYLIFYFSNRVKKAIIHDFWITTPNNPNSYYISNLTLNNWEIPNKCNTPIIFILQRSGYIIEPDIKHINSIFSNVNYILFPTHHRILYSFNFAKNVLFYLFNSMSLKTFWNNLVVNFIKTDNKIKKHSSIQLKIYILYLNFLLKRNSKKLKLYGNIK